MFDSVIVNGMIIDGTGNKRYLGSIGIKDGKIAEVGKCLEGAEQVIDAIGSIVCPGFIDNHSHSDLALINESVNFGTFLEQGITTEIAGMCGLTLSPTTESQLRSNLMMLGQKEICGDRVEELHKHLKDFSVYMNYLEQRKLGTNFAVYVGHGAVRAAVMGLSDKKPTDIEMEKMKEHLRTAMNAGAMGISTGLIYPPGSYSDEDEIVALCEVVAEYDGSYCSHIRNEGDRIVEAIREAISIGRRSGVRVNISHIKIAGKDNWDKCDELIALIDNTRDEGVNITADMYPYKAGCTFLMSSLPPKYASEGIEALIEKLKNPEVRMRIKEDIFNQTDVFENLVVDCGFEGMLILKSNTPEVEGKTMVQIAKERNMDLFVTYCDLIVESEGSCMCGYFMGTSRNIEKLFSHPMIMGGTDGTIVSQNSPAIHPRYTGTFPKLIKDFVKSKQLITLEEAIRKCTSLPAETAGFDSKGVLKAGYDADIVILDYENLDYTSDYGNPAGKNKGFKYVIVNGEIAVKDDCFLGVHNGRVIKNQW